MQGWKRTARWGALIALLAPAAVTGFADASAARAAVALDPDHVTSLPAATASGPMALSTDGALLAVAESGDIAIYRTLDDVRLGTIPVHSVGAVASVSLVATTGTTAGTVVIAGADGVEFDPWTTVGSAVVPGTSKAVATYADTTPFTSGDVVDVVPVSATRAYALLRGDRTTAVNRSIALLDVTGADATKYVASPLMLPDVYSALAFSPRTPAALYALTQPGATSLASSVVTISTTTGASSTPVLLNTTSATNPALSLAVSPDGARLYVGEENQLVVVSTATRTQSTTVLGPASAGYPTGPQGWTNPFGMPQYQLTERTACDAVSVSTDGSTVYCTGTKQGGTVSGPNAAGANLYWFDAITLKYEGALPLPGDSQQAAQASADVRHAVAATASRAYVALADSSVTSIPAATVLRDNAVPYGSTPDAPSNVKVNPGNEQFTVSWSPPANTGGVRLFGYEVDACVGTTCDPNDATQLAARCTAGDTGTTCTITTDLHLAKLVPGSSYWIAVTALNAVGAGTSSVPIQAKLGVPTAPTGVTLGASSLTTVAKVTTLAQQVSWTAPGSSGASAITSYQVCVDPVAVDQKYCQAATLTSVTTSATVTGLTLGASYVLTVNAVSSKGHGVNSAPLTFVAGTPAAPTALSAKGLNQSISLTWSAPATTGGSPVTGYTATVSPAGGSSCGTLSASSTSCTITGLKNGTAYTVTVAATNANGTGPRATATATPASGPGKPTITTVTPNGNGADVTWTVPTDDGGSPITGYTVTASYGPEQHTCTAAPAAATCTLTGLKPAQPYAVTVRADNAVGKGQPSNAYQLTLPGAPTPVTGVVTQVSGSSILVQWNPPSSAGAASIAGYRAVAVDSVTGDEHECATTTVPACAITGLRAGVRYVISVYATNSDGTESDASSPRSVTIIATPGRPTATTRRHGDRTDVTLRWHAVPGATSYRVRRTGGPVLQVDRVVGAGTLAVTFPKQRNGLYHYTVTAQAGAVSSSASAELIVKVKAAKPVTKTPAKSKKHRRH